MYTRMALPAAIISLFVYIVCTYCPWRGEGILGPIWPNPRHNWEWREKKEGSCIFSEVMQLPFIADIPAWCWAATLLRQARRLLTVPTPQPPHTLPPACTHTPSATTHKHRHIYRANCQRPGEFIVVRFFNITPHWNESSNCSHM